MPDYQYDLVVIGSGPAGQKAAIAASKLGKRTAIIDKKERLGGVSLHTGTIPSKTIREAIMNLTGFRERSFYGKDYRVKDKISVADLAVRVQAVLSRELQVVRTQIQNNNIAVLDGTGSFKDDHGIEVKNGVDAKTVTSQFILVACGTRPAHNPLINVDAARIFDSDQFGGFGEIPREIVVVGAGVIGLEYASMFSALGTRVTIVEQRPTVLDFVDREITDCLLYHLRRREAILRFGEKVTSVNINEKGRVVTLLESGKTIQGDALLYTVGRQANSDLLNLSAAGLSADSRGKIQVNETFQTNIPHIYAAGDVIGFPALAATSMEQGRIASHHMFGVPRKFSPELLPYGIYSIPEISMVGKTEEALTEASIPYEVGIARYEELAKAQMLGDESGILKILFDPKTLKILGVHAIGERAAEIVHIGQAVMALDGTMEYFRDTVFNYPTMAEAYKVAAFNGLNKL